MKTFAIIILIIWIAAMWFICHFNRGAHMNDTEDEINQKEPK